MVGIAVEENVFAVRTVTESGLRAGGKSLSRLSVGDAIYKGATPMHFDVAMVARAAGFAPTSDLDLDDSYLLW